MSYVPLPADDNRIAFVHSVCTIRNGKIHEVTRREAFSEVPSLLLMNGVLNEFPLRVRFQGEMGYDVGGVCRDMFSCFWEESFKRLFDGSSLLVPVLHPHVDMSVLPRIGMILSHGYLLCGVLPTRIIFPALAYVLLGFEIGMPPHILIQTFTDTLSSFESSVIKEALGCKGMINLSEQSHGALLDVLSKYGCRSPPKTAQELNMQILGICYFNFRDKPLAAMRAMREGIPDSELPFWLGHSVEGLYDLYLSLCATPQRVLESIDDPEELNMSQARVLDYLKQFIGNMKIEEVRRFLRFTTGSSVLLNNRITVTFNSLSGLARRPIAHTCGCIIELPSSYMTYPEFEMEFNAILADNDHVWKMDIV